MRKVFGVLVCGVVSTFTLVALQAAAQHPSWAYGFVEPPPAAGATTPPAPAAPAAAAAAPAAPAEAAAPEAPAAPAPEKPAEAPAPQEGQG